MTLEDWCWERQERDLDRHCAHALARPGSDAFLGVEHGALAALQAARRLDKLGIVAFLSPHRRTRMAWVDAEYERRPELRTAAHAAIDARSAARDARRDAEAATADWVVTNSSFTTDSLIEAGVPAGKLITVPLGGPDPVGAETLPAAAPPTLRYLYVGPVSVRKGAHYLLDAWKRVAGKTHELHFYGQPLLPAAVLDAARRAPGGDRIHFHGSVPSAQLRAVYQGASVLVFPTLCDGFGMVVSEAMACGLPVITTRNAGARDWVTPGQSGFVIPPADVEALAAALQWCADHPNDLLAMRRVALETASRCTWKDFRRSFRDQLNDAVNGARALPPVAIRAR
jgi:glycosyltransferase involved in cell wall biosynthesis